MLDIHQTATADRLLVQGEGYTVTIAAIAATGLSDAELDRKIRAGLRDYAIARALSLRRAKP